MSRLRTETIDVIIDALENGDLDTLDWVCRDTCGVMDLICNYVEKHGNIALSVGPEWMYDDDMAQVDALKLVADILEVLAKYAEEEAE